MIKTIRIWAEIFWSRLLALVIFFALFVGVTGGVTYLLCVGSEPGDACGDLGLVVAPFTGVFSVITTHFLMKRLSALKTKSSVEEVGSKPEELSKKQKIVVYSVLIVIILLISFRFFTLTKYGQ